MLIKSLIANIIGRFMAAAFFSLCHLLVKKYKAFRIKKLLGPDAGKNRIFHVFYPGLKLREIDDEARLFLEKTKSTIIKNLMKDDPVRQSEVRAICYLNNLFSLVPGKMEICSDNADDIIKPHEMSQICLGEWNANIRTINILEMKENRFIKMKSNVIRIRKGKGKFVPFPGEIGKDSQFDYGLILRLSGKRKEKKVWIACIGNSGWSTSGAAYYLANNWKKLFKSSLSYWKRVLLFPKVKDFAAVIKVKRGKDDTAELVDFITR